MELLLQTPYILRVIISLSVILLVNKITKQLTVSILLGTLVLAFWSGHNFESIISISIKKVTSANTLFLVLIIFHVIWLSMQMAQTGYMKNMVSYLSQKISKKSALAVLPAIIGLLPMPGGAIFSAPLLDEVDFENSVDPILKTKINYWFRHIWEYWWPLYPGVLLAIEITHLSIVEFMFIQLPLSIISISVGYLFLLKKLPGTKLIVKQEFSILIFIKSILPVFIVIFIYAIIKLFLPFIEEVNKYIPMLIGIIVAQIVLQLMQPLKFQQWKKILFSMKTIKMNLLVVTVLVFGAFVTARLSDGIFLMEHIRLELSQWKIPVLLVMLILPFVSGVTSGLAIGFVGASFPIVVSLFSPHASIGEVYSYVVIAYGFGYMGMLLSPVHICLIVTNEHFHTKLFTSLTQLIKPILVVVSLFFIYFFLLRWIF